MPGRWKQEYPELEVTLGYTASLRPGEATGEKLKTKTKPELKIKSQALTQQETPLSHALWKGESYRGGQKTLENLHGISFQFPPSRHEVFLDGSESFTQLAGFSFGTQMPCFHSVTGGRRFLMIRLGP